MIIDGNEIEDNGVFFIAEVGVNHNGSMARAKELIDAAAAADADAVKFQTFETDRLVAEQAPKAEYQKNRTGTEGSQHEMLEQYELTTEEHEELLEYCNEVDITFLSSPFDRKSVDLLDELDVSAIKVGSGELTNHQLLRYIAKTGRPVIVSTGMATLAEVEMAVKTIRDANSSVAFSLLHCVSSYPAALSSLNLRAIETMNERFSVPIGYSDHSTAVETPAFAVSIGAQIIEKHMTLDKSLPGPDHEASLTPDELDRAVTIARRAAKARGTPEKKPVPSESENRKVARKSLHTSRKIGEGEILTRDDVVILRPANGLSPAAFDSILGKRTTTDLDSNAPITAHAIANVDEE
ncbi:N-acetylneuraminate synthase [Haladaptatus caseinilyticus]|uniref:N-acetylneuraminate synthase n=1 Tax=Haladaptatus caseinilyticus TaxID=2993314 RepID=UPI00224B0279|nr:N-acetylneuraminate synthase [Haladaptatus caseinilyticus]